MRSLLKNIQALGQKTTTTTHLPMNTWLTPHDVNHHLHIPAPGRVQYYRAEALPFVPTEIKCQIRFPKAYAQSTENMRYLDTVQEQIQIFMDDRIPHNYFTGEEKVPLTATLEEAEVLYGANQQVREMAASGELQALHQEVNSHQQLSHAKYTNIRSKIENVIQAIESKEDEIVEELCQDFPALKGLKKHADAGVFSTSHVSLANARIVEQALNKDGLEDVKSAHHQQYALISTQIEALKSFHQLQEHWVHFVERDADTEDVLRTLTHKHQAFEMFIKNHDHHESENAGVLASQLEEAAQEIGQARKIFTSYNEANSKRSGIFASFQEDTSADFLNKFNNDLLHHLAGSIIVRENRTRYQKEQFDRLLASAQVPLLKRQQASMEEFARNYCNLIEGLIEISNGGRCPKIQANYDSYEQETIKPLNSAIFYYFFSGDMARRKLAQWMLASARYPNQKVRMAYMKFFS